MLSAAMPLYVTYAVRGDARLRQGLLDGGGLTVYAWGGETNLASSIIAEATAENDAVDLIAVGDRVLQPLQEDDARAAAKDRTAGGRVERAAMTVRRDHAAFLMQRAAMLWEGHRRAPSH